MECAATSACRVRVGAVAGETEPHFVKKHRLKKAPSSHLHNQDEPAAHKQTHTTSKPSSRDKHHTKRSLHANQTLPQPVHDSHLRDRRSASQRTYPPIPPPQCPTRTRSSHQHLPPATKKTSSRRRHSNSKKIRRLVRTTRTRATIRSTSALQMLS
jgi:hypothetical protein